MISDAENKIYARLTELESEVVTLRDGYLVVNRRYSQALLSMKTLTNSTLEAALRAAAAAEKSSLACKNAAQAAQAADARCDGERVHGVAPVQHAFEAAVHGGVHTRLQHPATGHLQLDFEVAFDAVERPQDQSCHGYLSPVLRGTGGTTTWSLAAFFFTRLGVALLEREASATNQALGMSVGRPTGMPASLGVM